MSEYENEIEEVEEEKPETEKKHFSFSATGRTLKILSAITLGAYLIGNIIIENGVLHVQNYTSEELQTVLSENENLMSVATFASALELFGMLCIPLIAFLLVEGYKYTSSKREYFKRLAITAVVSEVLYDLAVTGKFFDGNYQNMFISILIAFFMLYELDVLKKKSKGVYIFGSVVVILAATLWTILINCQFGIGIVLLSAIFYLMYRNFSGKVTVAAIVATLIYMTAGISGFILYFYDGNRGEVNHPLLWYALYPIALAVCYGATLLLG